MSRNTAILFYHKLGEVIYAGLAAQVPKLMCGEIEANESYPRLRGDMLRPKAGAGPSAAVAPPARCRFLACSSEVHVVMIPTASSKTLPPIIKQKIQPDSIVDTNSLRAYDVLDVFEFHHLRINHSKTCVDEQNRRNHINGIENFCNQAKRHLRRDNSLPRTPIRGHPQAALPPRHQGVRVALQQPLREPVGRHAHRMVVQTAILSLPMSAPKLLL